MSLSHNYFQGSKNSQPNEDCQQTDRNIIDSNDATSNIPECAVCLQPCVHPACLPCTHVFCYLCVKGVANQSKGCPMCRQEIPTDFLEHPQLLELDEVQTEEMTTITENSLPEEYQWYYEGRNGWWQYDQRTNIELETTYKQGKQSCELFIAGFLYIADFTTMFQIRRNDHSRRRRIKRDLCNVPKKGIAGLRLNQALVSEQNGPQQQQQQVIINTQEIELSTNYSEESRTLSTLMLQSDNLPLTSTIESTNEELNSLTLIP